MPPGEPDNAMAVREWIERRARRPDRFDHIRQQSEVHRLEHGRGCTVYPSDNGKFLGVLTAAVRPVRVLEAGCGLGYSACWLAWGAGAAAHVETMERDPLHAELARSNFEKEQLSGRISVLQGHATAILRGRTTPYDLIFCDSDPDDFLEQLDQFLRLLSPQGVLVTSNLFLGQYVSELRGADQMAAYRERILADERLITAFLPHGLALSVWKSWAE